MRRLVIERDGKEIGQGVEWPDGQIAMSMETAAPPKRAPRFETSYLQLAAGLEHDGCSVRWLDPPEGEQGTDAPTLQMLCDHFAREIQNTHDLYAVMLCGMAGRPVPEELSSRIAARSNPAGKLPSERIKEIAKRARARLVKEGVTGEVIVYSVEAEDVAQYLDERFGRGGT